MPVYERSTAVAAPLADVWHLYGRAAGLVRVTPDWFDLRIEAVRGPDGSRLRESDDLVEGSTVASSVRPLGVGPRQRWTSRITARREADDHAFFRDEMVDGPFPTWVHTHRFVADGRDTVVHDRVEYELPGGPLGRLVGPFGCVGLEPLFRYRHRCTRELLE